MYTNTPPTQSEDLGEGEGVQMCFSVKEKRVSSHSREAGNLSLSRHLSCGFFFFKMLGVQKVSLAQIVMVRHEALFHLG